MTQKTVQQALNDVVRTCALEWRIAINGQSEFPENKDEAHDDKNERESACPIVGNFHFYADPENFVGVEVFSDSLSLDVIPLLANHMAKALGMPVIFHSLPKRSTARFVLDVCRYAEDNWSDINDNASNIPLNDSQKEAFRSLIDCRTRHSHAFYMTGGSSYLCAWSKDRLSVALPEAEYRHWSDGWGANPEHPFLNGVGTNRFESNPHEKTVLDTFHRYLCHQTADERPNIDMMPAGRNIRAIIGRAPYEANDRDHAVINATIQWLGTPVGNGFLEKLFEQGIGKR